MCGIRRVLIGGEEETGRVGVQMDEGLAELGVVDGHVETTQDGTDTRIGGV